MVKTDLKTLARVKRILAQVDIPEIPAVQDEESLPTFASAFMYEMLGTDAFNDFLRVITGDTKTDFYEEDVAKVIGYISDFFGNTLHLLKSSMQMLRTERTKQKQLMESDILAQMKQMMSSKIERVIAEATESITTNT